MIERVYKVTNVANGKCYVGKTKRTAEERLVRHCYDAKYEKHPTYFHKALLKYGIGGFVVETLEETTNPNECERAWIARLHPVYNLTAGGHGGDTSNSVNFVASLKVLSERMKGNTLRLGKPNPMTESRRRNIAASRTGKPHPHRGHSPSDEVRRKISETLKRRNQELR